MRRALFCCILACAAAAQEASTPPAEPSKPAPDYIFAFAAPASSEAAASAIEAFNASPAEFLVLCPAQEIEVAPAEKPVFIQGKTVALHTHKRDSLLLLSPAASGAFDGEAHLARRAGRGSRWSIGFAHHYTPLENPRLDLVLFRDDPLDYLIVGESPALSGAAAANSPFGPTVIHGPAPDAASILLLFAVNESGMAPYNPE